MSLISQGASHLVPSLSGLVANREKAQGQSSTAVLGVSPTLGSILNSEGKYLGTHHPWEPKALKGDQEPSEGMLSLSKCRKSRHLRSKAVHPTVFLDLLCSFSAHSDGAAICPRLSLKHLSQYQARLCKHWSPHCLTTLKASVTGGHRRFCDRPGTKWIIQNLRPTPL